MGLTLVTPPAAEPVTLSEAKAQCRVLDDSEDEMIINYMLAARQIMESRRYPGIGCALITQTWAFTLDAFPEAGTQYIELPMPPVQSVTSITTTDSLGNVTTVSPSAYFVDTTADPPEPARIVTNGGSWPGTSLRSANGITITFVAGFGATPGLIPMGLKVGLLMLIGHMFMQREATVQPVPGVLPFGYDTIVGAYRQAGVA